jgi:hypothetical protein
LDRKQVLTILCKQTKMLNKRLKCSHNDIKKRCQNVTKITISLQKDYNYN